MKKTSLIKNHIYIKTGMVAPTFYLRLFFLSIAIWKNERPEINWTWDYN